MACGVTRVGDRAALTLEGRTAVGSWTSPVWEPRSTIKDLVASWQAITAADSWIETV
jgi:hypothetical protein